MHNQTEARQKAMPDELHEIEGDFEVLAERLAALIAHYAEDPMMAAHVDGLRLARDKAARAAELVRTYQAKQ